MYTLAIQRDFIARHFLIGGDWGPENELHAHHYRIELQLEGGTLDEHGYLVDIVDVEVALETMVDRYRDRTLNELPEFEGLNPSVEHFARIVCRKLNDEIAASNVDALVVRVWENEIAWASYRQER